MKLNSTTEMMPCSFRHFTDIHPFAPIDQSTGYHILFQQLEKDLCTITGYDRVSFQPNRYKLIIIFIFDLHNSSNKMSYTAIK